MLFWLCCLALCTSCRGGPLPEQRLHQKVYHRVQPGQTLWSIARAYGVDLQTLVRANDLTHTDILHVGQKLYIPGAARQLQVTSRCPCESSASTPMQTPTSSLPSPQRATRVPVTPKDAAKHHALFIWPLLGTLTRDFSQNSKHRHDGIDIAAPHGTLIQAAADGKVIFSDWGPGGYGRIVILRHTADTVTVYAHNHENLVRVGQVVRQGDPIATVGKSGRASGPHLHFEIRQKTVPVSPFKFLSRDQHVAQLSQR